MAESKTLHDAFLDELRDAYDAEKQLIKALPKMARAASSDELRTAFQSHLEETRGHAEKLEQAFAALGEKVRGKHCDGIAGIIEEGKKGMEEDFDEPTMDAVLIAGGQRAEHYEMAAYGTLIAWSKAMQHDEVTSLLEEILEQEKAADEKLTTIAEGGINSTAASSAHPAEGSDDGDEAEAGSGLASMVRSLTGGRKSSAGSSARGGKRKSASGRGSSGGRKSARSNASRASSSRSTSSRSGGRSAGGRKKK